MTVALIAPVREKIIELFHSSVSQLDASLLLGIVFGIKEQLPKEFSKTLQTAGVTHIIAASGMNVTMVAGFFASLFGLFLKRQHALVASLAGIGFYAFFSGLEASIVRATIMGGLVFLAQIMGRQTMSWYLLLLTAFAMLFWQPYLLFDVGFQLSFAATLGLIVLSPIIHGWFHGKGLVEKLVLESELTTTLAAQVATVPILLTSFGSYSLISLLSNALILWTIPILMVLGGIGALTGLVIPFLGKLVLLLSLPFLWYIEWVVVHLGSIEAGGIKVAQLSIVVSVGYYLVLAAFILSLRKTSSFRTEGEKSHSKKSNLNLEEIKL